MWMKNGCRHRNSKSSEQRRIYFVALPHSDAHLSNSLFGSEVMNEVEEVFGTSDVYAVFGVEKDAGEKKVKTRYRKLALKYHPDRNRGEGEEEATRAFQLVSRMYAVLTDPERRAVYNETGDLREAEGDAGTGSENAGVWKEYFAAQFDEVTTAKVAALEKTYPGSPAEVEDVIEAYPHVHGDVARLVDWVPFATHDDIPRLQTIVDTAIADGSLAALSPTNGPGKKKSTSKRKRNKARSVRDESAEAEALAAKLGLSGSGGGMGDLAALIQSKQKRRGGGGGVLDQLLGDDVALPEIDEDEFAAIQAEMDARAAKAKRQKALAADDDDA